MSGLSKVQGRCRGANCQPSCRASFLANGLEIMLFVLVCYPLFPQLLVNRGPGDRTEYTQHPPHHLIVAELGRHRLQEATLLRYFKHFLKKRIKNSCKWGASEAYGWDGRALGASPETIRLFPLHLFSNFLSQIFKFVNNQFSCCISS